MRSSLAAAFLFACAFSVSANTITSITPSLVRVNSGEHFLTINGTTLGTRMVFDGPAGHFEVNSTAQFAGSIVGWVPEAVVMKSGIYAVHVRDSRGGQSNSVNFTVQGFKFFPLAILTPDVLLIQAKSREGADGTYEVFAAGSEDPRPVVNCSPKSGSFFKFGVTKVTCNATSNDGQKASAEFTVQVADMMEPILKLPEPIRVEPKDRFGAIVDFKPTAFDEIYGEVVPECLPRSGSLFPIGRTTVTCSATDVDLNTAWGTFEVDVLGDPAEPLVVVVPDTITEKAKDARGATVRYEVSVKNSKTPNPSVECSPKSDSLFPLGTTTVVCNAWDENGARGVGDFAVNVIDPSAPDILRITPSLEKLPNDRRHYPITIAVEAIDDIDLAPVCMVIDVTANEALDLPGDGEKDSYDYRFTDLLALELRGEATEKDRTYEIHVDCTDFYGNSARGIARVFVPFSASGQTTIGQPGRRRSAGK
ncbi:MAG TPA: HYR domain-containing protein [Thermoanaerobaculia bacterium]|nr:HYR domain-containing protein [Thermoanaerobaculia bacterium]